MNAFEVAVLFAIPGFILLMAFELAWSKFKGPDTWQHLADAVSSISSGMTYLVLRTLGFGVLVISYDWVFDIVSPAEALTPALWLYAAVFLWKDFTSYWIHRWAHANSFLWAMHLIHHSSEEFNLPVALRQNAFNWFSYGGIMLMPLALLGVPTEVIAVVLPIQFFMQFWYHTQHVGKLGVFEYFLVTPSQHRVHHACNPRYIDKNFGQIFCWDRLFGTFQEELKSDPPVYGITTPVRHYNPVMIELNYMGRLLRDAIHTRHFSDKLRVFFSRTGWRPEDVSKRWPDQKLDYQDPSQKFRVEQQAWLLGWSWLHLSSLLLVLAYCLANIGDLSSTSKVMLLFWLLAGVAANTQQLMLRVPAWLELARIGLLVVLVTNGSDALSHWSVFIPLLMIVISASSCWVSARCGQSAPVSTPAIRAGTISRS